MLFAIIFDPSFKLLHSVAILLAHRDAVLPITRAFFILAPDTSAKPVEDTVVNTAPDYPEYSLGVRERAGLDRVVIKFLMRGWVWIINATRCGTNRTRNKFKLNS